MLRIHRILRDYENPGSLNSLIALWGLVDDHTFLTKAGHLGVVYRLAGVETSSVWTTRSAATWSIAPRRRFDVWTSPVGADTTAQDAVRDLILAAYAEYEQARDRSSVAGAPAGAPGADLSERWRSISSRSCEAHVR